MTNSRKAVMAAGYALVWQHGGLLVWVFLMNAALGVVGALPAAWQLHHTVRHTLAGDSLYKGFDLGMFYELTRLPEVSLLRFRTSSYLFAGLFAVLMLVISGGILEAYRRDRRIKVGEFFAASGAFFWRFVRLALLSLILFALIGNAYLAVDKAADHLGDKATADQVGFLVWLAGVVLLVLLTFFVRLWFDLAKVRAVAEDEHYMVPNMLQSLDLARPHLPRLMWMYLRISLVAGIVTLVAFVVWTKLPPTAIWATFILLELVMLAQLWARLWQLASLTVWYKRYVLEFVAPSYVVEAEPQLSLYPETELPPADA